MFWSCAINGCAGAQQLSTIKEKSTPQSDIDVFWTKYSGVKAIGFFPQVAANVNVNNTFGATCRDYTDPFLNLHAIVENSKFPAMCVFYQQ